MPKPLRVGAVSYLNAKPLYHRFDELAPGATLVMDVPSRLASRLAEGSLDVALIPSVEYLRGMSSGYRILPGFAIAARGAVRSVKLFSRVPLGQIRRLALDEGSRTSQALVRVLLAEVHGVCPEAVEPLPLGVPIQESTADAILLIGDRAMHDPGGPFHTVMDLAEAWRTLTGLPFVFALWVVRAGVDLGDLPEQLDRCRSEGLAHADDLAAIHGPRLGLDVATCLDYLTNVLSYDLGVPELAGLRLFAQKAAALGLAPEGADLVFYRRRDLATRR
ncbi:menaquinone biosynthesis protein [Isosphaeraceae bacterium EP7]